jgi:hypothetical protein
VTDLILDRIGDLLDSSATLAISHARSDSLRAGGGVTARRLVTVNSDEALLIIVIGGQRSGRERLWELGERLVGAVAGLETGLEAAGEDGVGAVGAWDGGGEGGGREGDGAVDD